MEWSCLKNKRIERGRKRERERGRRCEPERWLEGGWKGMWSVTGEASVGSNSLVCVST